MTKIDRMICPDCGVEMNHHADKMDFNDAPDEFPTSDTDSGGVLIEAHACPECGGTATRTARL